MSSNVLGLAAWVAFAVPGTAPAAAPGAPVPSDQRSVPWANVTPENEVEATKWRDEGNQALFEGLLEEAEQHYQRALRHWDHPAIHYNYAQVLLKLFRPLECLQHLEAATRHGPDPLGGPQKFEDAMRTLAAVEAELTRLEIRCDEPGARVTLDDRKDLIECPGAHVEWMRPGPHVVSIAKQGFEPRKKTLTLQKGKRVSTLFEIFTKEQAKRTRSRWPWWLPWTVAGAGAAVAGTSALAHVEGYNRLVRYDADIAACAATPQPEEFGFSGCPAGRSQELAPLRAQGYALQRVGWGMSIAGGAALVAGGFLFGLNLPETYTHDPDPELKEVAVAPILAPGVGGVSLTLTF